MSQESHEFHPEVPSDQVQADAVEISRVPEGDQTQVQRVGESIGGVTVVSDVDVDPVEGAAALSWES